MKVTHGPVSPPERHHILAASAPEPQPSERDLFLPTNAPPEPMPRWKENLLIGGAAVAFFGYPLALATLTSFGSHHGGTALGVAVGTTSSLLWGATAARYAKGHPGIQVGIGTLAAGMAFRSCLTPGVVSGGLTWVGALILGGGAVYAEVERFGERQSEVVERHLEYQKEYEQRLLEYEASMQAEQGIQVEVNDQEVRIGEFWLPRDEQ